MDEQAGLDAIARVVEAIGDDENVHSVGFHYDDPTTIIVTVGSPRKKLTFLSVLDDTSFKLEVREGPEIEEQIGNFASESPLKFEATAETKTIRIMGGHAVTTSRAANYYGTISIIGRVRITARGIQAYDFSNNQGIVSNNHVIAQNDTGVNGDRLSHRGHPLGYFQVGHSNDGSLDPL